MSNDTTQNRDGPRPGVVERLEAEYEACELHRPFRRDLFDPGHRLEYQVTGVLPANTGRVVAEVERFVGGGFAGQVYKVELLEVTPDNGPVEGLEVGRVYALKILTPPSAFSRLFRNALFSLAYQGPFSAQVNPAAVRVGVLWQKLVRRAVAKQLGNDSAVCDTYATLFDADMHSFGEINEWIDGRIWKFEVDDRLFDRWDFEGDVPADHNAPEYVHKKHFMRAVVEMLHDIGAPELARQYEWWSLKSQPNVLKRLSAGDDPAAGLTAVDFRAGLALLPFLPMSPVDVPLILRGLLSGRWVQFDRPDPEKRRAYLTEHADDFADLQPAIEELEEQEKVHRGSLPDVTDHHFRLLFDPRLRDSVSEGTLTAWQSLGHIDGEHAATLRHNRGLLTLFWLVSLVPFFGTYLLSVWGNRLERLHAGRCFTDFGYQWRAMRGSRIEALIRWHRAGRMSDERILALVHGPVRFWAHRICLGWLPGKWHRFATDRSWAWARVRDAARFAYRFLRRPSFREEWLLQEVRLGREDGMLTAEEAERVTAQIKDPFMQKYLRCLAVHVCTVPVTQVVMLIVGAAVAGYLFFVKNATGVESIAAGSAAGALIQLSPISPGSMARGLFVLYLMIKERDVRNYYIAAPVAFIHVIGYLAFPMQMVAHNAALARFMAGRWARNLVHVIPVFGEKGGLIEHAVFDLFFNLPLSLMRAIKRRPLTWAFRFLLVAVALAAAGFAAYVRLWEWSQPQVKLASVRVESTVPFYESGGDLHWSIHGTRVYFADAELDPETPVDFPADRWDESVQPGDRVDAIVRRSYFNGEYDGLSIEAAWP